ncbi:MAG: MFS transporter [Gammaproteobacteria bacterium]|nr:MFS transporter [Gammaproteobacteria bacterium]
MKSLFPLLRTEWRMLLFGFVMMFFSSPGQTYFIALFGGEIRQDLALSHGEFGALYSLATLASAFILLLSGTMIDRIDLRRFATVVVLGLAASCVLMSISMNNVMLFVAILLLRQFGQGLMSMTAATAMVRHLADSKGKANSLSNIGYSAAEAVLPSVVILLLLTFTWRQAWVIVALVLVVCVPVLIFYLLRKPQVRHHCQTVAAEERAATGINSQRESVRQRQWTRSEVLRDPLFYLFIPALLSQSLLYTGFMFHQIHLVNEKGWPLLVWGSMYLLFSLTAITTSLVTGVLVDKVGAVRLAPLVTAPMALGLLVLSSSSSTLVAALFMFCMGASTGAQAAITTPFFSERYGNKYFGAIKSLGTFVMVLMTAVSPVILGWFIDRGVGMDALAQGSALYALLVITLGYTAYRISLAAP